MIEDTHDSDLSPVIRIETPQPRERVRLVHREGLEPRRTARDALRIAGIHSGDRLTPGELELALAEAEPAAALERAVRLLGYRERSHCELVERLSRDGYPEPVIESIAERLTEWGYLDDRRYTETLTRTKRAAGWGRMRIARALRDAGISDESAAEILDDALPEEAEIDRARALVRPAREADSRDSERQIARLVRKGFSYQVARNAVERDRNLPDESR